MEEKDGGGSGGVDESMLLQDPVHSDEVKLREFIVPSPTDFGAWTSLIADVEKASPVDVEKLCLVYDSFLSLFPLCYGYWKNYAGHMAHLCNVDKVVEVYERALQFTTYSVHLWVDYCTFAMLLFEDPMDVRRLFERGISFVGKDYLCHLLWDKYIEFEYSQKQWSSLAHIYVRTLKFPSKNLNSYYASFKKLATIWEEDVEFQNTGMPEVQSANTSNSNISNLTASEDENLSAVIRELLDPAFRLRRRNALHKFLFIGEQFYQKASQIKAQIHFFESRIRRPYFHVKPLDVNQLENWHCYLDFVEMRGDFDWTVKLHERCLIPCANYPEFWVRYVEIMESRGGREIAKFALARATEIFLKNVPVIHLFNARFKEKIGDVSGAHAAFHKLRSELDSDLIENVRREAHMEKRLGNSEAALNMYEKALEMAKERENSHTLSILYIHFCRFKYMVTGCIDSARDIIIKGIQNLPNCKLLLEGLINFEMTHRGPWKIHVIDSVVAHAISPGLDIPPGFNLKDREDISNLFLEFVDQCGTIDDIRKAWDRHRKLFPHLMTATSYNCTAERQDILITLPHHASGDNSADGLIQQSLHEQKLSLLEKPDSQSDHAITDEYQSEGINGTKQISQPLESLNVVEHSGRNATEENAGGSELMLESPNVVEHSGQNMTEENTEGSELMLESPNVVEHSGQNAIEENAGDSELMHEVVNHNEAAKSLQEYCEEVSEAQKTPDREPNNDMRPPSLENLSLNSQGNEARHASPIMSHDCEGSQATTRSHESKPQNGGYSDSISSPSSARCIESGNFAQVHVQADSAILHSATDPTTDQSPVVPTTTASDSCAVREGNWYHMNSSGQTSGDASSGFQGYPQSQHPQQWQVAPQQQYQSSVVQPQMIVRQVYPSQPQFGQNPQMQPGVRAQNQYQVPAAQVQHVSGHALSAGNVQQQSFPSASQPQTSSQPVSYPQAQFYQYPPQGNEHYGHMQNSQGYTPQMWHYYYLQQQQQQQQQQQKQQQQQQQHQQQQLQQSQQLLLLQQQLQQQQQQLQSQLHNQQISPSQIQTWNNSYYQQVQVAQGQGTALVITDASGPAVYQSHPPQPPTN